MDINLSVSSSPHIRAEDDTRSIMLDVLIALAFPLVVAVYFFGLRALSLTCVSVAACIVFEWLYCKIMRRAIPVKDLSAVVTGVLIAFVLPVSTPYWMIVVGDFFGIVVVKQLYGGIGKNFLNPALAARAFLTSFPVLLSKYTEPFGQDRFFNIFKFDAVTSATPLSYIKNSSDLAVSGLPADITWQKLVLGQIAGCVGEVSSLLLVIGGVYLLVRKVINARIPVAFVGTVAALTFFFPRGNVPGLDYMLYNLLSGGLLLGAVFMATDYTTSPVTTRGQWIYGICCGLLTVLFRYFSTMPEGVCYAILLMNTVVWLLDRAGMPRRFGGRGIKKGAKGNA